MCLNYLRKWGNQYCFACFKRVKSLSFGSWAQTSLSSRKAQVDRISTVLAWPLLQNFKFDHKQKHLQSILCLQAYKYSWLPSAKGLVEILPLCQIRSPKCMLKSTATARSVLTVWRGQNTKPGDFRNHKMAHFFLSSLASFPSALCPSTFHSKWHAQSCF